MGYLLIGLFVVTNVLKMDIRYIIAQKKNSLLIKNQRKFQFYINL